ncbi:MAG: hypothetical protein HOO12_02930 [Methylococcales bacterium]|nr:hypothetical protein [Methylococcales bacterium]MBT5437046.1 hypothetical protein [Methylococcales bacterium]
MLANGWEVSLLLRLMNSLNVRRERFVFGTTLSLSLFDKDFFDEFRQGVDAHLDGEEFYLQTDLLET